jgi:nitrogen regulatory protein P-II 1
MMNQYDLIITIVNKGYSQLVIKASKEAGAEGGTTLMGRGAGIHETKTLLGIPIEPEKEIVLTAIPQERTDHVLNAIVQSAGLNKPGAGVAFVVELKKVAGICHLVDGKLVCDVNF